MSDDSDAAASPTHIEVTDRYAATGYPDPETVCQGQCEGTGRVPVYVSRGDYRIGPWTRPDDETDEALRALWYAAEKTDRSKDTNTGVRIPAVTDTGVRYGWHFVDCPGCGGTGTLTKAKPIGDE